MCECKCVHVFCLRGDLPDPRLSDIIHLSLRGGAAGAMDRCACVSVCVQACAFFFMTSIPFPNPLCPPSTSSSVCRQIEPAPYKLFPLPLPVRPFSQTVFLPSAPATASWSRGRWIRAKEGSEEGEGRRAGGRGRDRNKAIKRETRVHVYQDQMRVMMCVCAHTLTQAPMLRLVTESCVFVHTRKCV